MNSIRTAIFTLTAGLLLTLFSCDFSDDGKREFTFTPDVILLKKEISGTVQYALAYYVYSNQEIASAQVLTPEGETIPLASLGTTLITHANIPEDNDFSTGIPLSGLYTFTATNSEGTEVTEQDMLADTWLTIPEITDITYHSDNFSLDMTWTPSPGSDNYFVKILTTEDKETVYTGYQVDPDSTSYTIHMSDQGWEFSPTFETTYILQLNAILYEENIDLNEYYYHVNTIAIDEQEFTWGQ